MNKRPLGRVFRWIRLLVAAVSVMVALLGKATHTQATVHPTVAPVTQSVGQPGSASTP